MKINIPPQQIYANSKGGFIIKGGVMSSEYGNSGVNPLGQPPYLSTMAVGQGLGFFLTFTFWSFNTMVVDKLCIVLIW